MGAYAGGASALFGIRRRGVGIVSGIRRRGVGIVSGFWGVLVAYLAPTGVPKPIENPR